METNPVIADSVLKSLSGTSDNIIEYLPYLLQDLWALGSSPDVISEIIHNNGIEKQFNQLTILDLGCGKGSASILLAKQFNAEVYGIDAMPGFIEDARRMAESWKVSKNCVFETGDIRNLKLEQKFCIVIFASIGDVLGNMQESLVVLEKYILPGGYLIIEDGYIPNRCERTDSGYLTEDEYYKVLSDSSFSIADKYTYPKANKKKENTAMFNRIKTRACELIEKYPNKSRIFEDYIESQSKENEMIENEVELFVLLLKKN